jgi:endoglucanase
MRKVVGKAFINASIICLLAILLGSVALTRGSAKTLAAPLSQAGQPTVRVNQVGYLPNLPKLATVVNSSTSPLTWQLKNSGGTVVASGSTTVFGNDAASGEQVHLADFSAFTTPGTGYTLVVGSAVSHPFDIGAAVYHTLKYDALAYFYHNRSGIAITTPFAGGTQWTRPAGHIGVAPNLGDTNVPCASDAGCSYSLNVSGGWYDAGDQGKYVVNGGISVWTLMDEYERTKFLGTSLADFGNGKMNIPENGNGVPDLLDEARWEMEFLLKMQVPAGQPHAGMAHHKMHDANWTGIPQRPDLDSQQRVLRPVSTAATLNLAATAAQCARIWAGIDATFSNKCLTAAQTAWSAAQANPSIIASGSDGNGGGAYGDNTVQDEFYWAAAELYITTGSSTYLSFLTSSPLYKTIPSNPSSMSWGGTQALGTISLAVVPNNLPAADITSIRNNIVSAANAYVNVSNTQGYRVPFAGATGGAYYWGDNSDVANNGIVLGLAYDFTGSSQYLNAASEALNYLLGRNAMSKSYVSGYGENPLVNPHHRFWAHQADASFPAPPPGALAGGPNSGLEDPFAQANLGGCKPQKCYVDNYQSYSTNEVAINWNAPLAWLTAFLDEKGGGVINPTLTPTRTATRTNTPVISLTPTRTPTRTNTPAISNTPTLSPTPVLITNPPTRTATRTSTPAISNTPTRTPTRTNTPAISNTPTLSPTPVLITNTPTRTATRTNTPAVSNTPTRTPTPGTVGTCSPVNATITAPFTFDGAGTFCWQSSNLGTFINNWNMTSVTLNGVNITNVFTASSAYPAKINGFWYVVYNGPFPWSHFETKP